MYLSRDITFIIDYCIPYTLNWNGPFRPYGFHMQYTVYTLGQNASSEIYIYIVPAV